MKIKKFEKLVCSLNGKKDYFACIRTIKHALYNGLVLQKLHKVIKFNKKAWLKLFIDMNTQLRKNAKQDNFFELMSNSVFGKSMENLRQDRNIKLVRTERRRNYLVSELNYRTAKWFSKNIYGIEMKKDKGINE